MLAGTIYYESCSITDQECAGMAATKSLPETGFLNLDDIVCRPEISPEQSAARYRAFEVAKASGDPKAILKARFRLRNPRPATRGLLPICRSTWLNGVRAGKFPKPVKLGLRTTVWRCEDIRALIESFPSVSAGHDAPEPTSPSTTEPAGQA